MEVYSHSDQTMEKHLREMKTWSQNCPSLVIACHDAGKATGFVQKYLQADEAFQRKHRGKLEYRHSLFGAVLVFYYTLQQGESQHEALYRFMLIWKHHDAKGLPHPSVIKEGRRQLLADIQAQLDASYDSMDWNGWQEAVHPVIGSMSHIPSKQELLKCIKVIGSNLPFKKMLSPFRERGWMQFRSGYASLVFSDTAQVVSKKERLCLPRLPYEELKVYLCSLAELPEPRESREKRILAERETKKNFQRYRDTHDILHLILPMGLGKTLLSLELALDWAGEKGKVMYIAPFTSLLSQFEVLMENFAKQWLEQPLSFYSVHHLASAKAQTQEYTALHQQEVEFAYNALYARIAATSFNRFIETLIRGGKQESIALESMRNSVVIIDEPQVLDSRHHALMKNLLMQATQVLNMKILIVTGTNPYWFSKQELPQLAPLLVEQPPVIERTKIVFEDSCSWLNGQAGKDLLETEFQLENRTLIVLNRIEMVSNLARKYIERKQQDSGFNHEIIVLSTALPPRVRKERMEYIKETYRKQTEDGILRPILVIATQLVETGFNTTFDIGHRDWGPMENILQFAGRINRYMTVLYQSVHVHCFHTMEGKRSYDGIYSTQAVTETLNLLSQQEELYERDYTTVFEQYKQQVLAVRDNHMYEALEHWHADNFYMQELNQFRLIKQQESVSFFINTDAEAQAVWEDWAAYWQKGTSGRPWEKKSQLREVSIRMQPYLVTVRLYGTSAKKLPIEEVEGIYVLNLNQDGCYCMFQWELYNAEFGVNVAVLKEYVRGAGGIVL